jgi:predicted DsbA family dithiol-disulfide isomerase
MNQNTITVDVVSDVACPWCYVGKRNLEEALKQWKGAPIEVNWHPYQLDPAMRAEGMNRDTYLTSKFGSLDKVEEMANRLISVGKTVGINFDFGENWLAVNTLALHQLIHVANQEGRGGELKERLLSAYFVETRHLNKREVIYETVKDFGWDSNKVDSIIDDEKIAEAVKSEISNYQQRGVSGVPFFVINDKFGISGAQPVEAFLKAFKSVDPIEVSEGDGCKAGSGCC